jgi:hypothetical protein
MLNGWVRYIYRERPEETPAAAAVLKDASNASKLAWRESSGIRHEYQSTSMNAVSTPRQKPEPN